MLISILFVSIIIVYGFIGLKKGGIKSIEEGECEIISVKLIFL